MNRNLAGFDIAVQFGLILTVVLLTVVNDISEARYPFLALGIWQIASAVMRKTNGEPWANVYFKCLGWGLLILLILGMLASIAEGLGAGIIFCGFGMLLIGLLGGLGYFFACLNYFLR